MRPEESLCKPGRTRVSAQFAIGIKFAHEVDVIDQRRRQVVTIPQSADAVSVLGKFRSVADIESVYACARVGIDIPERCVFLDEVTNQFNQQKVF